MSSDSWLCPLLHSYHMCLLLLREPHHVYCGASRCCRHIGKQHAVPEGSCVPVVAQWMGQRKTRGAGTEQLLALETLEKFKCSSLFQQ